MRCDYEFSDDLERPQLEIKWYFNDDPVPFYIWVPAGGRPPQIIGSYFEDHVDVGYVGDEVKSQAPYLITLQNHVSVRYATHVTNMTSHTCH